jgi:hypothetical protein
MTWLRDRMDHTDERIGEFVRGIDHPVHQHAVETLQAVTSRSAVWSVAALALSVFGGKRGRQSAGEGVLAVALVTLAARLADRNLPRQGEQSGLSHAAGPAFAFAFAVSRRMPALSVALVVLAVAVGYVRIHTGASKPSEVAATAVGGTVAGLGAAHVAKLPVVPVVARVVGGS